MGPGSKTLKSRCWRSLPSPAHLLQASYPVFHVVTWQNDAAFPPLLPLVLCDDPQCLLLLAGFPPHPQHHSVAAPCLVLENHADSALGQIDGGADEPGSLAFLPSAALQLQVISDICQRGKHHSIIFCSLWQQVSHLLPSGFGSTAWQCSSMPTKVGSHKGSLCAFIQLCHCCTLCSPGRTLSLTSLTSHHPLPG